MVSEKMEASVLPVLVLMRWTGFWEAGLVSICVSQACIIRICLALVLEPEHMDFKSLRDLSACQSCQDCCPFDRR